MDVMRFMAVGDIMLSRNRGTGRMIESRGPHYPFEQVQGYLSQADVLFGNLEGPASLKGASFAGQDPHVTFSAWPQSVQGLAGCGFDVLSLANNHACDYGHEALQDTIDLITGSSIACAGAGASTSEAYRPVIIQRGGIRIGVLAYTAFIMFMTRPPGRGRCGVAVFSLAQACRQIRKLAGQVDVVAVSMHWGMDFTEHPLPLYREYARRMIDAGAHLILGHHPHYLQGIERYRHGIIAYSLGDFIFDEPGQDTMILELGITKRGIQDLTVVPARITPQFQTRLLGNREGGQVLDKVRALSSECACLGREAADELWRKYIITNLSIFLKSYNTHALRNLMVPVVAGNLARLYLIWVKKRMKKRLFSTTE